MEQLRTKKGEIVHCADTGKPLLVDKVLINGRIDRGVKDYIRVFPMHRGAPLTRSVRTVGENWI